MLDQQVAGVPLRPGVAALWTQAFTPLRIGKGPVSWLVLRPEQLSLAQPRIENGAIAISLGLTARGRILVQDAPPANPAAPLPRPAMLTTPFNGFSFAVPILLPYDRAAQLAMASLANKPLRIASMAVRFNGLQILPSGQDVIVSAQFCADPSWDPFGWFASCGKLYLRGKPVFDPVRQTIRIVNLHYDIASANLLLKAARALRGSPLAQSLQSRLVFGESAEIGRLKNQVAMALATPRGRGLSLSAQVQSFGEPYFTWTADGFLALFSARGQVNAALNL
jgi:hypothetical protein